MQTVILLHLCGIRARLIFCIVDNVWISSAMLMKQANGFFPFRSDIDYFLIHHSLLFVRVRYGKGKLTWWVYRRDA